MSDYFYDSYAAAASASGDAFTDVFEDAFGIGGGTGASVAVRFASTSEVRMVGGSVTGPGASSGQVAFSSTSTLVVAPRSTNLRPVIISSSTSTLFVTPTLSSLPVVVVPGQGTPPPSIQLVAYDVGGARRGGVPKGLGLTQYARIGEIPTVNASYTGLQNRVQYLAGAVEVAFQYSDATGNWREPINGRFFLDTDDYNRTDQGQLIHNYTFLGYVVALRYADVGTAAPLNADGQRVFNAQTPGAIMLALIHEAKALGLLKGLEVGFTSTRTSDGQPWTRVATRAYDPASDLLTVLQNFYEAGLADFWTDGRTLHMSNPDTTLGRDLATGNDPVYVRDQTLSSSPENIAYGDMVTMVRVIGDGGKIWLFTNPLADKSFGERIKTLTLGGVSDEGTAKIYADQLLEQGNGPSRSLTREYPVTTETRFMPERDYRAGDWLKADTDNGSERMRAFATSLREDGGNLSAFVTLGSVHDDLLLRLAKRQNGITGGSGVNSGGTPAPAGPDNRIPKAPLGLVIQPEADIDANGFQFAMIGATWSKVEQDTTNAAIEISAYELYYRVNKVGEVWRELVRTTDTSVTYSPLKVKTEYSFKIRALSEGSKYSAFSAEVVVTMPSDTTPPPIPSLPILTTVLGTATARWDGKTFNGTPMPFDFKRLLVWQQGEVNPTTGILAPARQIDQLQGAGFTTVGGLTVGKSYAFAFQAEDYAGNLSGLTDYVSIQVASAAEDASIQAELDQIVQDIQQDVSDQIATSASGANKITYSPNPPSTDGSVTGDTWFQRGASNTIIGQWEWSGSAWVPKTLTNVVVTSLDAGKITTGEMDGIRIRAGSIRADRLSVGMQDNLLVDPLFLNADINALRSANGWTYEAATRSFINTTATTQRFSLAAGGVGETYSDLIKVNPGEKYYMAAVVKSTVANDMRWSSIGYGMDGAQQSPVVETVAYPLAAGVSTAMGRVVTIPAGVYFLNPQIRFTTAAARVEVRSPSLVRQVAAVVIEDGAITATKLAAASVTADNIAVGALDAMLITAPIIRTSASGTRSQFDSQGLRQFYNNTLKIWMNPALGQMRFYSTGDVTHTSTGHAIQFGDDDGPNLVIDPNEIMARNAGSYETLNLNREGGGILMGGIKGGFTADTLGRFPANDDHHMQVRASLELQNASRGDYADEFAPLMVGPRGERHLWADQYSIGSSSSDFVAPMYLNPPYFDGTDHTQPVWLGSNGIAIRRIGPAQAGVFCPNANVTLQFIDGQVNARDSSVLGNRNMGAADFVPLSQTSAKEEIGPIPDALALVQEARSKRWKFRDEINPETDWHYGPMAEDMPAELRRPIGEDQEGYSLTSAVGLLWEAVTQLAEQINAKK